MMKLTLLKVAMPGLTVAALLLFFLVFVSWTFYVFKPNRKEFYKQIQNIPFQD